MSVPLSTFRRVVFSLLPVTLLLVAGELAVRASGAGTTCSSHMNLGVWVCDPILQYRLRPDLVVNGRPLNSDGFRSREFTAKKPGTFRVLVLGDSCSFGIMGGDRYAEPPYPGRLEELFDRAAGPGRVEVLNAGVPAYTSYHGVMLLRTRLAHLDPDLVLVRYGWNDHLQADVRQSPLREPDTAFGRWLEDLALHTQLYAFTRRLAIDLPRLLDRHAYDPLEALARTTGHTPMIPPELYARNLARIVELAGAMGARTWFVAAPRNPGTAPAARSLIETFNRIPFDDVMAEHDRYLDVMRGAARTAGVPVIEMPAVFAAAKDPQSLWDSDDAMHPNQAGHDLEAATLFDAMRVAWPELASSAPGR